jgi:hypothetical protein
VPHCLSQPPPLSDPGEERGRWVVGLEVKEPGPDLVVSFKAALADGDVYREAFYSSTDADAIFSPGSAGEDERRMKRVSFAQSELDTQGAVQEAEQQLQGAAGTDDDRARLDALRALHNALTKSKVTVQVDDGVDLWTECGSEDAELMFQVMAMVIWGAGEGDGGGGDAVEGSRFRAKRLLVIADTEARWNRMRKLYDEARQRLGSVDLREARERLGSVDLPRAVAPQKKDREYKLIGMNEDIAKREDRFVLFVPGHADKWLGGLVGI